MIDYDALCDRLGYAEAPLDDPNLPDDATAAIRELRADNERRLGLLRQVRRKWLRMAETADEEYAIALRDLCELIGSYEFDAALAGEKP